MCPAHLKTQCTRARHTAHTLTCTYTQVRRDKRADQETVALFLLGLNSDILPMRQVTSLNVKANTLFQVHPRTNSQLPASPPKFPLALDYELLEHAFSHAFPVVENYFTHAVYHSYLDPLL